MGISEKDIMNKLKKYLDTSKGRCQVDDYINDVMYHDKAKVLREYEGILMEEATEYLYMAKRAAENKGVPQSVLDTMDAYYIVGIVPDGGTEFCYTLSAIVGIDDSRVLERPSLEKVDRNGNPLGYTIDSGVDNIVALFNNGYSYKGHVHGAWTPHNEQESIKVQGVNERPPLKFMEEAAEEFSGKFQYNNWLYQRGILYGSVFLGAEWW